jgi:hypothetical protein
VFRRGEELNINRNTVKLNVSKVLNIKKFCATIPENLSMKNKIFRSFGKIEQNRFVGLLPVHPRNKMAHFPMEESRVFNTK